METIIVILLVVLGIPLIAAAVAVFVLVQKYSALKASIPQRVQAETQTVKAQLFEEARLAQLRLQEEFRLWQERYVEGIRNEQREVALREASAQLQQW